MKNTFLFLILVTSAFFFSCTNNQKSVIDGLQAQVDSLQAANSSLSDQQSEISDFLSIITQSLDSIAEQENYIRMAGKGVEGSIRSKAELKKSLAEFAALLERQRNRIAQLEDSLVSKGESFEKLGNIISYLNQQIDDKNRNITALKKELDKGKIRIQDLSTKVEELSSANDSLANAIEQQSEALVVQSQIINEGYYLIGTKKELLSAGVLTGGTLAKKKLNPSAFADAGFTKVDISQFTELTLNAKSIEILTQMPSSSYQVSSGGGQTRLLITDPTKFWSISNYLVIKTK